MSLFSWFFRKPQAKAPAARPRPAAPPLRAEAAPLAGARNSKPLLEPQPTPEQLAGRKNERMERRELLYTVVRDAMVRAGVLSAGYKFKVLSLDQRGAQFLVMMDLVPEYGSDTARLSEIEAMIAQAARTRFDILVTAVYWRVNDQAAGSRRAAAAPAAATGTAPAPLAPTSPTSLIIAAPRPAPARNGNPVLSSRPAPLVPPAPPAAARTTPRFEPIEADEVAAFKQALVHAAATRPVAPPPPLGVTTRSGPLLPPAPAPTGFEDTVMPGQDGRVSDLSTTQYGDLR
ncbi:hypothetical protein [Acidovorax sp. MR-S7]|uniref:hypothetical protein n=1 Tax=Acidovorax sp. MR-S7 TaxID=1268622 RepID=UPI00035D0A2A|nr:hypothetical protein [Acidovorax sp. MR-S7]GAD21204.1 hypothetical protein AVS7_00964 [Acidovorax sp. MR-S7]